MTVVAQLIRAANMFNQVSSRQGDASLNLTDSLSFVWETIVSLGERVYLLGGWWTVR